MKQDMERTMDRSSNMNDSDVLETLIALGKRQGYLTYEEVNDVIPADTYGPDQVDDLLMALGRNNIRVVDDIRELPTSRGEAAKATDKKDETGDSYRTNDPVRMYLRKMGSVSLLTREGEIEIAKRIETGENTVLDAILPRTCASSSSSTSKRSSARASSTSRTSCAASTRRSPASMRPR